MSRSNQLATWLRERGVAWTAAWVLRDLCARLARRVLLALDARLAAIERRRFLIGPDTFSATRNSVEENRRLWTERDWSQLGEDWTEDAARFRSLDPEAWKREILERFLLPNSEKGGTILEIGPGGGRWTEHLLDRAQALHLVDVSPRCLDLCRARFGESRISFHAVDDGRLDFLADASIDFIWSYDVFVHVTPGDTDVYLAAFARVLRPGARAVLHHPDQYPTHLDRLAGFRSNLTARFVRELCHRHGLTVLAQDLSSAHKPGDCITLLERPACGAEAERAV